MDVSYIGREIFCPIQRLPILCFAALEGLSFLATDGIDNCWLTFRFYSRANNEDGDREHMRALLD